MKIRICIDRKYVLIQSGQDLGETTDIEVTREQMGETWEAMVANLSMDRTPPFLTTPQNIKGADAASVALALRERAAENAKKKQADEVRKNESLAELSASNRSRNPRKSTMKFIKYPKTPRGTDRKPAQRYIIVRLSDGAEAATDRQPHRKWLDRSRYVVFDTKS